MRDPIVKTIGYRLTHTARLQKVLAARLLSEIGLFPGQDRVLKLLLEKDGRTMGDLAEVLRVRPPTVSKTIARLTSQGLVERRAGEGDGRLVRVFLTAAGRERSGFIDKIQHNLEAELTRGLNGKERRRLRKLMRKIEKNLMHQLGVKSGTPDEPDSTEEDYA